MRFDISKKLCKRIKNVYQVILICRMALQMYFRRSVQALERLTLRICSHGMRHTTIYLFVLHKTGDAMSLVLENIQVYCRVSLPV